MLPRVDTDEDWRRVVPDDALLRPGVLDLCARLGFAGADPERFTEGSQPVYAVDGGHVLKLFPAMAAGDGIRESRTLEFLHGRLPVATPEPLASGTYDDGWHYVLMSRLPGRDLALAWPGLPPAEQDRLVETAGGLLAALHALDPGPLADDIGPGDWDGFVAGRRAASVRRQRERGLPEEWCGQIDGFLDAATPRAGERRALLHTEFMRQHLLVAPDRAGRARLSGLLDFEPAMTGDPDYDLVAVGLFVTRGDRRLMTRFTKTYGRTPDPRAVMAYTLLHVYSNLPWYLREVPPPDGVRDLASLAETWFGTG
ncbi:aminoglycoside 3'-phosphotransferase/choline kinase family protein [Streptomyces sp. NPDC001904]|uniref:phosphotransferase family protein n=1 Tax=Streptomyces sp. NPDC001904 TaxID=3154531 RepID=UPI0033166C24